ncbi:MAG: hypothetical protein AB1730_09155 [Myxococcota bacterium]
MSEAPYTVAPLSARHLEELTLAVERAAAQWVKGVEAPLDVVQGLERVLLFLKQNGGASPQARHIASLAFVFGEQVVRAAGWTWQSVSEDGSVNPAIVSPDARRALLVVDVVTRLVVGADKASLTALYKSLVAGEPCALVAEL